MPLVTNEPPGSDFEYFGPPVTSYDKMTSKGFECQMVFDDSIDGLLNYYQSLFQASYENG